MAKGSGNTRNNGIPSRGVSTAPQSPFSPSDLRSYFTSVDKVFYRKYSAADDKTAREIAKDRVGTVFAPKGEIKSISVSSIQPAQEVINASRVLSLATDINKNGLNEIPTGLKVGETVYLLDGHHRVAAQIILGQKKVKIRIVEASQAEWNNKNKK